MATADRPAWVPTDDRTARQAGARTARLIVDARRPVLYVGGGVLAARRPQTHGLAELTGIPVVTTLMARGAFPDGHALHMGMPGMHGTVAAVGALQKSDLMLALGARFDDRVTGRLDSFAPDALIVHADIDPAEISKNRVADVPIVGTRSSHRRPADGAAGRSRIWTRRRLRSLARHPRADADTYPLGYTHTARRIAVTAVRDRASRRDRGTRGFVRRRCRAAPDVGGPVREVRTPWHLAELRRARDDGFCGACSHGSQGRSTRIKTVWAIDGDGCFQMTNQELATCAINDIPIKVAVINNSSLGMVRQWQTLFYERVLQHRPAFGAHSGLRQAGRGLRLRGAALRVGGRC